MKSLIALFAGTVISANVIAASEVNIQLDFSSDGYHWERNNGFTYASGNYSFEDGQFVDFASEDNVPWVTPDGNLQYPASLGGETSTHPSVKLTLPDGASGGLHGAGSIWHSFLMMPDTTMTVSGTVYGSHVLNHDAGSASYRAELIASDDFGNSSSIVDIEQSFAGGSSNLTQQYSYTFHNDSDQYAIYYFSLFATADISGTLAPIPEPATYATMLLGLAALTPVARATRRKREAKTLR